MIILVANGVAGFGAGVPAKAQRGKWRAVLLGTCAAIAVALPGAVAAQSISYSGSVDPVPPGTSSWTVSGSIIIGDSSPGTLTIANGASVTADDVLVGTGGGDGILELTGTEGARGVLRTESLGGGGPSQVIFDGGMLQALASTPTFVSGVPITIQDRGAFIDSNGFDISIGTDITGTGGLTKLGEGTLTLTQRLTYDGPTMVRAGTLYVNRPNRSITWSDVTVDAGARLIFGSATSLATRSLSGGGEVRLDDGNLFIGVFGDPVSSTFSGTISGVGLLNVDAGELTLTGAVSAGELTVCDCGSVTITGENASLNVQPGTDTAGIVEVLGTLNVLDGATFTALGIGVLGSMTIDGAHTTATIDLMQVGDLIGPASPTVLTISGGAQVSNTASVAIMGADAVTMVRVTGAQTSWSVGEDLIIGVPIVPGLTGTLEVSDGGRAHVGGFVQVGGAFDPALGVPAPSITVTGAGSALSVGDVLAVGGPDCGCGGDELTGILTVADGGIVTAAATEIGAFGTLNIGTGGTGGQIDTPTITNDGAIIANFTDTVTLAAAISGTGSLTKLGSGQLVLSGASTYSGGTQVSGGTLSVLGSIAGPVNVEAGAVLAVQGSVAGPVSVNGGLLHGNGSVGSTTVIGGTIAPGNSIGTLTVNGDLALGAGSTYAAEINAAGQSDLLVVTGTATISGAALSVALAPGTYVPGTTYTLLAAGNVVGGFASVSITGLTSPFLSVVAEDGTADVTVTIARSAVPFSSVALTANAVDVANAVDTLPVSSPISAALVNQTSVASANAAFNALSGEVYPSTLSILQSESLILRRAVLDRARAPVTSAPSAPLAYATKAQAGPFTAGADVLEVPGTSSAFWTQAFGAWNTIDGNGNAASISGDTGGVFVGYDRTFSGAGADWRLGFAAGYSSSSYQVDARSSSFSSDNIHLALYGGASFGALGVRFGGAYSWADIDASRTVAFPGFLNALTSDTSARTGQVFGEVGYSIPVAAANIEPFAGLAYVNVDLNGVTEVGGPAALTTSGASQGVTYSTLGARVSVPLAVGVVATRLTGTLAWQHAFGGTTPEAQLAFATGSSPFTVWGVPVATDAALVEAGLDMSFTANTSLSVFYAGQLAETEATNMVKGTFTLKF